MELKVSVKKGESPNVTDCQLEEIASRLCVRLPDQMRLVWYGQTPPLDTTLTWQPTNGADDPVGSVRSYQDGEWK